MRTGYDSTNPHGCPDDGDIYLGYNDGTYEGNYAEQKKLHPTKLVWSIGRFVSSKAQWYDVETGLLTPVQGAALAKGNVQRGEFAGLYCNESSWETVRAAVAAEGLTGKVQYWIAWEHGGQDEIPEGAVGRQYLLDPGLSKGDYDKSVFVDHIPGLDAPLHHVPGTPLVPATKAAVNSGTTAAKTIVKNMGKRTEHIAAQDGERAAVERCVTQMEKAVTEMKRCLAIKP